MMFVVLTIVINSCFKTDVLLSLSLVIKLALADVAPNRVSLA